ncbi:hypothetical protein HNQ07_004008 [Deinococcus metalli]|uniref:Uncharacterized protein n=1 Tax=Deinococcus metalli TaxID=1141878 RepID=A0A7W8NR32_9DEIO|nr:hypothetical protein [Deinococcus metalli]
MNDLWHVVFTQQSLEERAGGLGIPVCLQEDVQHGAALIHGPPQPEPYPTDIHVRLVTVPLQTPSGFAVASTLVEQVTELDTPRMDGLVGDSDPPFEEPFFTVPVAVMASYWSRVTQC